MSYDRASSSASVMCSTACSILRINSSRLKSSLSLRRDVNLLLISLLLNFITLNVMISFIAHMKLLALIGIDDVSVSWHKPGKLAPRVQAIMEEAKKYVGVPYRFGGMTPSGFDCSGFIHYVFNKKGILLPRAADEQFGRGERVSVNRLEPGDLVFFSTYESGVSHSGLYLGDGYFISATSSCGVAVATMKNGYWHDRYVGAKRVL